RIGTLENSSGKDTRTVGGFGGAISIAYQTADVGKGAALVDCRKLVVCCQRNDLLAPAGQERTRSDEERMGALENKSSKGRIDIAWGGNIEHQELKPECPG